MMSIMARNGLLLAAGFALAAPGACWAQAPEQQPAGNYIVVLQDDTPAVPQVASEHAKAYGLAVSHLYSHALKGYSARIPEARLARLRADPRVAFISEDKPVHMVRRPGGGSGGTTSQTIPTGVARIGAKMASYTSYNSDLAVAVIDTGSGPHPDLNIVGGVNCSTGKSYADGNGHGTHVAGTIGAINNISGVVGVLPGAPIYSVRVLNNAGSGTWSSVVCGIDWVVANNENPKKLYDIKVANMSLGGSGSDDGNCGKNDNDALHQAICGATAKDVLFVVAAGNDGKDLAGFVPAAYDEVLAVTAMADSDGKSGGQGGSPNCFPGMSDDSPASFSNFAVEGVDSDHTIAAPGVCIYSTWTSNGYNTISGTSMATPHVTGTAAACIAEGTCDGMKPSAIIEQLRSNATNHLNTDPDYGFSGDPNQPLAYRYYGHLIYAGDY